MLSVLILGLWSRTAYGEFLLLIGVSAENSMLRLITYICTPPPFSPPPLYTNTDNRVAMTHSEQITQIDTVRAYHSGPVVFFFFFSSFRCGGWGLSSADDRGEGG